MSDSRFHFDSSCNRETYKSAVELLVGEAVGQSPLAMPLSLSHGLAGLVVFLMEAASRHPEIASREDVTALIKILAQRTRAESVSTGFFSGLAGIAWVCHVARHEYGYPIADQYLDHIDAFLTEFVGSSGSRGDFDLMQGLSGVALYASRRAPSATGLALLARVTTAIVNAASWESAHQAYWRTLPEHMPDQRNRAIYVNGYRDLGTAHGAVGVLAVLVKALPHLTSKDRVAAAVRAGWNWLEETIVAHGLTYFAEEKGPSRVAWCYGAPGVYLLAHALLRARLIPELRPELKALLISHLTQLPNAAGVCDLSLCHGTGGLALLYRQMLFFSDEEALRDLHQQYLMLTTSNVEKMHREFGRTLFLDDTDGSWRPSTGLLCGTAGIGLCLIAAASDATPCWRDLLAVI